MRNLRERVRWSARAVGPERGGMIARGPFRSPVGRRPRRLAQAAPTHRRTRAIVADQPIPGRSLVTRRAVIDIVRTATLGSYGVLGFAAGPLARIMERIGLAQPGIALHQDPQLSIELDLIVALGLPVAEVARQVDSAVRYAVHSALACDVERLVIHVDGLRLQPGAGVAPSAGGHARPANDLDEIRARRPGSVPGRLRLAGRRRRRGRADSGSDVA